MAVFLLLLLSASSLFSASFDEVVSLALTASPDAEAAELNHEAMLLDIMEAELDDVYDFSIETAISPLSDGMDSIDVQSLSFSMISPDDNTSLTASVPFSIYYDGSGGDEVITIVDRSRLKATVEVDEIDMQYVTEGQSAELVFEAAPDQTVHAYVSYIPMLGRYTDQGIGVVDVELLIEDPPAGIIPGFTFEGTLANESETMMLMVPQAAITRQRGGIETVDVREADGTSRKEEIRTQYLGEGLAEVLSGNLKEGDILVYPSSEDEHRAPIGGPPL